MTADRDGEDLVPDVIDLGTISEETMQTARTMASHGVPHEDIVAFLYSSVIPDGPPN